MTESTQTTEKARPNTQFNNIGEQGLSSEYDYENDSKKFQKENSVQIPLKTIDTGKTMENLEPIIKV